MKPWAGSKFMRDGEIASDPTLLVEAKELAAMFTASLTSARQNSKRQDRDSPNR